MAYHDYDYDYYYYCYYYSGWYYYYTLMGLGTAGFADTTTTSTTDATTTATTAAPGANSATLMKHGPAGFTPSFVPYGSIRDALSIRVQGMDEARPLVPSARRPQSSSKGSSLAGRLRVRHGANGRPGP